MVVIVICILVPILAGLAILVVCFRRPIKRFFLRHVIHTPQRRQDIEMADQPRHPRGPSLAAVATGRGSIYEPASTPTRSSVVSFEDTIGELGWDRHVASSGSQKVRKAAGICCCSECWKERTVAVDIPSPMPSHKQTVQRGRIIPRGAVVQHPQAAHVRPCAHQWVIKDSTQAQHESLFQPVPRNMARRNAFSGPSTSHLLETQTAASGVGTGAFSRSVAGSFSHSNFGKSSESEPIHESKDKQVLQHDSVENGKGKLVQY